MATRLPDLIRQGYRDWMLTQPQYRGSDGGLNAAGLARLQRIADRLTQLGPSGASAGLINRGFVERLFRGTRGPGGQVQLTEDGQNSGQATGRCSKRFKWYR